MTEVMTLALPGSRDQGLDPEGAMDVMDKRMSQASALLVGCGLGTQKGTKAFVHRLCEQSDLPMVIDADGLNALADDTEFIRAHSDGKWILTPHAGEFKRLAGDVDLDDRIEVAREWANRLDVVLVLKGMPTVIAAPNGHVYTCGTGNPSLATAGTGDVLAGMTAGLLAQGLTAEAAAVCAVHVGGAAADAYAARTSRRTMMAMDLLNETPGVLHERFD